MPDHRPYHKASDKDRSKALDDLLEQWSQDWRDNFGKRSDGSMTWQCNAVDVMLLVDEIQRLRGNT